MLVTFLQVSQALFNFNNCVQFLKQSEACLLKIYIGPKHNNNFLRLSVVINFKHFGLLPNTLSCWTCKSECHGECRSPLFSSWSENLFDNFSGCFCTYSNSSSFEYVRDSLEKTLLSNLEQEDRLPFQGLPLVIVFAADQVSMSWKLFPNWPWQAIQTFPILAG